MKFNNKIVIKTENGYFSNGHLECKKLEDATLFYSPLDNEKLLDTMKTLKSRGLKPSTTKV